MSADSRPFNPFPATRPIACCFELPSITAAISVAGAGTRHGVPAFHHIVEHSFCRSRGGANLSCSIDTAADEEGGREPHPRGACSEGHPGNAHPHSVAR